MQCWSQGLALRLWLGPGRNNDDDDEAMIRMTLK